MNYFAEQAIRVQYFDLSDEFTTLSLTDSIVEETENLRTLELDRSVTIFSDSDNQKEKLTGLEALPFINDKPFSYLSPGQDGRVNTGFDEFEFVKDKYGCDSDSVSITDGNGKDYEICYNESVGQQLKAQNCPSGVVTINEKTVYGDETSYEAVYIAEDDNTATLELSLFHDGTSSKQIFTQSDANTHVEADAFSIASIEDPLDPYSLVVVSDGKKAYPYAADQPAKDAWSDPGTYEIKVVNRLGYGFTVSVTVTESDYATILFSGEGTEKADYILATYGDQNVQLPEIARYGYNLVGFEDENGTIYSDEISTIAFRGTVVLNAVWQAKQYTVTLQSSDGSNINTLVMDYGKEYELPEPELPDGIVFTGWTLNGTPLESNVITLQSEGDITLVASTAGHETSDEKPQISEEKKPNRKWTLCVGILVVVLAVALSIAGFKNHKKKAGRKKIEDDDETNGVGSDRESERGPDDRSENEKDE